ncbi:MAG: tetratricopeptide repeat protein [Ardenticatenaceae bacterium]|nr:tetratricopeptide repeat protein [Ardenticatenaceae bacterium]
MLSFTLLGQTVLLKNGVPLTTFRSQKEVALLAYLAHSGNEHSRRALATMLWENSSDKQALTNLRTVLSRLRGQVGNALAVTRTTVELTAVNRQQVDSVNLLKTLAAVAQVETAVQATTLQQALDSYQGEFLADLDLTDAPQFDQWVVETREYIHRQVVIAYDKLGHYLLATGEIANGIVVVRRWLQVDALDETANMLLLQLLLAAGKPREAAAHYEQSSALLRRELGISLPAKMKTLIDEARPQPQMNLPVPTAVRHNLSPVYDQFFGRQNAQQEIHTRLDQPWCRLVTITGQGGVGKTRLASTIARSRLSQYRDGVWLVALADIDPDDEDLAEAIAVEIATVLDLRLTGAATPVAQLLNHLQHKQMMLVLDNFEHLLAGVQIILDILSRCEQVQLVVTSREALRLRAEWTIPLAGLSYPANEADEIISDAVELFMARQGQQRQGEVAPADLAAIRQICHMVAGLPLAIELAAALTRHSTVQAIAHSLHDGFDALTTSLRDMPARHRELRIVFEMSWRTLTSELQQRLARLAVFRGGFTETAVQQITATEQHHLAALIDKSLLTYHPETARYTLHPVIRAYAAAKRPANDPAPHNHAHYYLTLLAQHTEPLQKKRPQESMHLLEPDIDNIRRAWQTGLAAQHADLLLSALTSLSIYYQLRGLAHEGEHIMHSALRAAIDWGEDGLPLATRAGLERARFQNRLGQYRPALHTIQTTLQLADQSTDRWAEGMAHVWWGESLWRLGEYDAAKEKLSHALAIGQDLDEMLIIGWSHHQLGIIHDIQGHYDAARSHLEKACGTWETLDNVRLLSNSLNSIGIVHYNQGNLLLAQEIMEQALTLCRELENRHVQTALLGNLSMIATEQEDYTGAQYYLNLSLQLATLTGDATRQGEIFTNTGRNYLLMGELDAAVENLERSVQIAKSLGNRSMLAIAIYNLAVAREKQGALETAEKLLAQALQIAQQDNLQGIECEALLDLARLLRLSDVQRAKQVSTRAVTLAESIQNPTLLERALALAQNLQAI